MKRSARGYSLAEVLVVLAIIAIISLVAVPGFMSMRQRAKMKASLTDFTGKVRAARQLAVTGNGMAKLRFQRSTNQYQIWKQTIDPTTYQPTWSQVGNNYGLEGQGTSGSAATITFNNNTQFDDDPAGSGWNSIVFNQDGTLVTPPAAAPATPCSPATWYVQIQSSDAISPPVAEICVYPSGTVKPLW